MSSSLKRYNWPASHVLEEDLPQLGAELASIQNREGKNSELCEFLFY